MSTTLILILISIGLVTVLVHITIEYYSHIINAKKIIVDKVNHLISKAIVNTIRSLNDFDNNFTGNKFNPSNSIYEDLTPTIQEKKDGEEDTYSEAIYWALRNPEIKNIALTGPYGSGKSSIIKTFEKKHKEYNYLNLSLASFTDTDQPDDKIIELSILQQIFYKVKHTVTSDSRFNRITRLRNVTFHAVLLTIWLFSLTLIVRPVFFEKYRQWDMPFVTYNIGLTVFLIIFLIGTILLLKYVLKIFSPKRFNKLNLTSGEIEIKKDEDSSILNKYLDEILYFFEVTKYNVVIIEDLDRFNKPDIFTKLRELNILINNAQQINRRIVFIYAIKDEIFVDKSRTKFFDFIIPVIPVINSSNSGEILNAKISQVKLAISSEFVNDISLYIDDMRILKNIINEFLIYQKKLNAIDLNQEKLLAIIIYKNIDPEDFSKLHINEGVIYDLFNKKSELIEKSFIINHKNKRDEIEILLKNSDNTLLKNTDELKAIYIEKIIGKIPNITAIVLNNTAILFSDLKNDEQFDQLKSITNIKYYINGEHYYSPKASNISFKDIEIAIDRENDYNARKMFITLHNQNERAKLVKNLEKINQEENIIQHLSLSELIKESDLDDKLKNKKILYYLLKYGYIDEMYHSYTSFFYEGSITKDDMKFVHSIKNQIPLDFNYKLTKINEILKKIRVNEGRYESILNYLLFDYLIDNITNYKTLYNEILFQLQNKSEKSILFIDGYLKNGKNKKYFIDSLSNVWDFLWKFIENEPSYSKEKKDSYLIYILSYCNINSIKNLDKNHFLSNYISQSDSFLFLKYDHESIAQIQNVLYELDVKFEKLEIASDSNNELFNFIYENSLYEINQHMINLIIQSQDKNGVLINKLKTANYTTVIESSCNNLIDYINNNIEYYVSSTFLKIESNIEESEKNIITLLNYELLSEDNKKAIILKENVLIKDVSLIPGTLWEYMIQNHKIESNWNNIIHYYLSVESFNEILIAYLNIYENASKLSSTKIEWNSENNYAVKRNLAESILTCNDISDENYAMLVKSNPNNGYTSIGIENLSVPKINVLLNNKILGLSQENFDLLEQNFPDKQIELIESDIQEYLLDITKITLDQNNDLPKILESRIISTNQKILLINKIIDPEALNITLINAIRNTLLIEECDKINFQILKIIFQFENLLDNKILILINQSLKLNKDEISELLTLIGVPYSNLIIGTSKRIVTMEKNQINMRLANKLSSIGYIHFSEDDKKIRFNAKR